MKKILALVLAIVMMLGCTAMFTSCSEEETLIGFDIDLARSVVDYLNETYDANVEIEFIVIDWDQKEALLENGSIDLVWNGMTITDERVANMAMSVPYLANKQVAIVAKDKAASFGTTIESFVAGAAECIVTFEKGSAGNDIVVAKDGSLNFGKDSLSSATQMEALNALKKGDADIAVIDSVMAGYYMNTGDNYKDFQILSEVVLAEEQYGIGAKKGNDALIGKINEALIALVATDYKTVADTYGLTTELLVKADTVNPQAGATDGSWDKIVNDGKIVIGYTKFAPIAYDKE